MVKEKSEAAETATLRLKLDRNQRNFFAVNLPLRELDELERLPFENFAELFNKHFTGPSLQRCRVHYFFAETNSYLVWKKEVPLERKIFEKGVFQLLVERIRSSR